MAVVTVNAAGELESLRCRHAAACYVLDKQYVMPRLHQRRRAEIELCSRLLSVSAHGLHDNPGLVFFVIVAQVLLHMARAVPGGPCALESGHVAEKSESHAEHVTHAQRCACVLQLVSAVVVIGQLAMTMFAYEHGDVVPNSAHAATIWQTRHIGL